MGWHFAGIRKRKTRRRERRGKERVGHKGKEKNGLKKGTKTNDDRLKEKLNRDGLKGGGSLYKSFSAQRREQKARAHYPRKRTDIKHRKKNRSAIKA